LSAGIRLEQQLANAPSGKDTASLMTEITANSSLLITLTGNYGTFRATQAQNLETVSIAAPASRPTQPASPKLALNLALGLVAGLLVALGPAAVAEYLDQGLDSEEDVHAGDYFLNLAAANLPTPTASVIVIA
jgi:uncharacterized protein involved in exopolysaccharide biosynthesis